MQNNEPKHSIEEIRTLFDGEVERFSNDTTGQTSAVDAAMVLNMIEESAARMQPDAKLLCDIGCGGGNFSIRIARRLPQLQITLIDLSRSMLERASARLTAENIRVEKSVQGDIRETPLEPQKYDVIIAGAVLHHLRAKHEWKDVFAKIYQSLANGGTFWYWDLIRHENEEIQAIQKERYAEYLAAKIGREQQEHTFEMIERSDTPETPAFIILTLHEIGFKKIDILHKNATFLALAARKFIE
ncbi:MAG: class I SAM-dependent methyltransferase [Planctomycetaceae bacterium]|nr:class I SAM-dependent methyltransferase [Planctomycetaceae bacterium]